MPRFNVGDVVRYRKPEKTTAAMDLLPPYDWMKNNSHWIVTSTEYRRPIQASRIYVERKKYPNRGFFFHGELVLVRRAPKKQVKK